MQKPVMHNANARGFTLVELIIAMAVMAIALIALISGLVQARRVDQSTRELVLAMNGARGEIELLKQTAFKQIFVTYNANPADDPAGANTAPGPAFAVGGLVGLNGAQPGRVVFPVDVTGRLSEASSDLQILPPDPLDPAKALPIDLNGNGTNNDIFIDPVNWGAPNDFDQLRLLPVRITIDWQGVSGNRHYEITTWFAP